MTKTKRRHIEKNKSTFLTSDYSLSILLGCDCDCTKSITRKRKKSEMKGKMNEKQDKGLTNGHIFHERFFFSIYLLFFYFPFLPLFFNVEYNSKLKKTTGYKEFSYFSFHTDFHINH